MSKKNIKLSVEVGKRVVRKIRARKNPADVWFGLSVMGLVGWSVILPTLLGAAMGDWLDERYPGSYSMTLALLIAGLCLGCLNAWHWVIKQHYEMLEEHELEEVKDDE